ncbi:hypothetical protein OSTOST_07841 [Ostertagia ostertagi]
MVEKQDDESGGGDKPGAGTGVYRFKGTREEYCEKFAVNYEYYCTGDSDNPQITAQFCPSYKKSCRDRPQRRGNEAEVVKEFKRRRSTRNPVLPIVIIESTHIVPRPANATGLIRMCKSSAILHLCRCSYKLAGSLKSSIYLTKFREHWLHLSIRLWYAQCPKYERYHYASQFIYSKAEKGKKVELPSNAKPFSVLSPNGERLPVNVRTPGTTTIAKDDPLPPDTVRWDSPLELDPEDFDPTAHVGKWPELTSIA